MTNKYLRLGVRGSLVFAALWLTTAQRASAQSLVEKEELMRSSAPKVWAVQINVTNLDSAIAFYTGLLEFDIACDKFYPRVVSLHNDGAHILLYQIEKKTTWSYDQQSHMNLNLFSEDLERLIAKLKKKGAVILEDKPMKAAISVYYRVLDPSGNQLHLMQLNYPHDSVSKPSVYNIGVQVTDMKKSRAFYCELLGFPVFSEKYYPPTVPLVSEGIQVVLRETARQKSAAVYPNGSQTLLTLMVDNLESEMARLKEAGVSFLLPESIESPPGFFNAVMDPDGNIIELLQWRPNEFDY